MARAMVTSYGMSDKIGPIDYGSEGGEIFLGRDFAAGKGYSEVKAAEIDDEIHRIIETAYHQCEKLLSEHMDAMTRVAEYLIRNETMDGETFKKVFNGEEVPDKVVGADLMSELQKVSEREDRQAWQSLSLLNPSSPKTGKKLSHRESVLLPVGFFCLFNRGTP